MQIILPLFVNNWTKGGEDGRENYAVAVTRGVLDGEADDSLEED